MLYQLLDEKIGCIPWVIVVAQAPVCVIHA